MGYILIFIVQSFCPMKLLGLLHFLQLFHQFQQLCRLHQVLLKERKKKEITVASLQQLPLSHEMRVKAQGSTGCPVWDFTFVTF